MPGRKIMDEVDARTCLEAAARSSQPRAAWARAHGVDARSLNAWRLNLARREGRESPVAALRLVELVPQASPVPAAGSGVRLRLGGVVIELDRDFDEHTLARTVDALSAC